ncbi:MAG: CPBP family intramembrane metalloprotease [Clostridia bacterium]|nr:CPBP family intramembrane metalloprotease [Clostridia bacterium]
MKDFEFDYVPQVPQETPTEPTAEPMAAPVEPTVDLLRERWQFASIALGVSFITLFAVLVQLVAIAVIGAVAPQMARQDWYVIALSTLPMYAVAMPLSIFWFRLGKAEPPTEKKKLSPLALGGLIALCFALTYVGSLLGTILNFVISVFTGKPPVNDLQTLTTNTPLWANLLFCGILAPILEEIFYRKMVIDRLRRYGDLTAVLMSGILFGLIHGNFYQFFYAVFIGLILGYVYLHTGRLRYSVILHMAINLIGGVLMAEISKRLDAGALANNAAEFLTQNGPVVAIYLLYLFFIFVCFIVAPIMVAVSWKHIRFRRGKVKLRGREFCNVCLNNPAVWLLLLIVLFSFVG